MVDGQLAKFAGWLAGAPPIEPAVAGPKTGELVRIGEQYDNRAGDHDGRAELGGAGSQRGIHGMQLGDGGLGEIAEIGGRLDRAQRGHDAGAGEIARLMPAHAVRDRPKTEIRPLEQGVFVALPHQPDMGQRVRGETAAHCRRLRQRRPVIRSHSR